MKIKCSSEKKSSKKVAEIISHFFFSFSSERRTQFHSLEKFCEVTSGGILLYKIWRNQEKNLKDIRTIIEQGIIFF